MKVQHSGPLMPKNILPFGIVRQSRSLAGALKKLSANHIRWYGNLLDQLHLSEFIYAGQDWGGPIAMGAFAKSPGRLQGMVVLNTFFNAVTEPGDLSPGLARAIVRLAVRAVNVRAFWSGQVP